MSKILPLSSQPSQPHLLNHLVMTFEMDLYSQLIIDLGRVSFSWLVYTLLVVLIDEVLHKDDCRSPSQGVIIRQVSLLKDVTENGTKLVGIGHWGWRRCLQTALIRDDGCWVIPECELVKVSILSGQRCIFFIVIEPCEAQTMRNLSAEWSQFDALSLVWICCRDQFVALSIHWRWWFRFFINRFLWLYFGMQSWNGAGLGLRLSFLPAHEFL